MHRNMTAGNFMRCIALRCFSVTLIVARYCYSVTVGCALGLLSQFLTSTAAIGCYDLIDSVDLLYIRTIAYHIPEQAVYMPTQLSPFFQWRHCTVE